MSSTPVIECNLLSDTRFSALSVELRIKFPDCEHGAQMTPDIARKLAHMLNAVADKADERNSARGLGIE